MGSTLKLVDTLAEQSRLEDILDESKPPVPPECRHVRSLLSTPFRYGAPYPKGCRFPPRDALDALAAAAGAGVVPRRVVIIGIEPSSLELGTGLSPLVAGAMDALLEAVEREVAQALSGL